MLRARTIFAIGIKRAPEVKGARVGVSGIGCGRGLAVDAGCMMAWPFEDASRVPCLITLKLVLAFLGSPPGCQPFGRRKFALEGPAHRSVSRSRRPSPFAHSHAVSAGALPGRNWCVPELSVVWPFSYWP